MTDSRSIHTPSIDSISFFYGWVIFHCIYAHIFFIHSSVDGHLECLYVLVIVDSAAMNIGVHVSFWIMIFSGSMPSVGVLGKLSMSKTELLNSSNQPDNFTSPSFPVSDYPILSILFIKTLETFLTSVFLSPASKAVISTLQIHPEFSLFHFSAILSTMLAYDFSCPHSHRRVLTSFHGTKFALYSRTWVCSCYPFGQNSLLDLHLTSKNPKAVQWPTNPNQMTASSMSLISPPVLFLLIHSALLLLWPVFLPPGMFCSQISWWIPCTSFEHFDMCCFLYGASTDDR